MYKYIIDSAGHGLNGMALLALLTFFTLLVIAIVSAVFRKKSFHTHMSALPLDLDVKQVDASGQVSNSGSKNV